MGSHNERLESMTNRIYRTLERLDDWHHQHKLPGSWIFCDLWEWRVTGTERLPIILKERAFHLVGKNYHDWRKSRAAPPQ